MRIVTAAQMREADRRTIDDIGVPSIVLMEHAGRAVVDVVQETYPDVEQRRVGVLCGPGNNGGDGAVAARLLFQRGVDVRIVLCGQAAGMTGDAGLNVAIASRIGMPIVEAATAESWLANRSVWESCDVLIDALFGTGLRRQLDGLMAQIVDDVNASDIPVVAVDLPSGLLADEAVPSGPVMRASATVTLAAPKLALVGAPADAWVGDIIVADIGIPEDVLEDVGGDRVDVATPELIAALVPRRHPDSHKGDYGRVLIVAGSRGKTGAARLAGLGSLRAGAGLVTVGTPRSCLDTVAGGSPEYMTVPLEECSDGTLARGAIETVLDADADVIAVGPGVGTHADAAAFVRSLVASAVSPLVLDADALTVLAGQLDILHEREGPEIVLTPHPGEMARLCGISVSEVQAHRIETARAFATAHGVWVVLKGARTVVATPDGPVWMTLTGNPGMATGGMGDVLTGVVAGWVGQLGYVEPACLVGVHQHGLAGDLAMAEHGAIALTATDVAAALRAAGAQLLAGDADDGG